jgi:glycine C-acetyltransferase
VFLDGGEHHKLPDMRIARDYDAIVAVDDSRTGVLGATGRGTEHYQCSVRSTSSRRRWARHWVVRPADSWPACVVVRSTQRSRPQLFSNALPPTVAASALGAIRQLEHHPELVDKLRENTRYFRGAIAEAGFKPLPGETPIVPIIVGETATAIKVSDMLLDEGVFVTGFGFPFVPRGRRACGVSSAQPSQDDLDQAIAAFKTVGTKLALSGDAFMGSSEQLVWRSSQPCRFHGANAQEMRNFDNCGSGDSTGVSTCPTGPR